MNSKEEDNRKNKIRHWIDITYIKVQNKTRISLVALAKRLCNSAASIVVIFRNEKRVLR